MELGRSKSVGCQACGTCGRACPLLARWWPEERFAAAWSGGDKAAAQVPYLCVQCGLCAAVCPNGCRPDGVLAARRAAGAQSAEATGWARRFLAFEAAGASAWLTLHRLPPGCSRVFFPGCAMPALLPETTVRLYRRLAGVDRSMGVVLDCCRAPSFILGLEARFRSGVQRVAGALADRGVKELLVGCPECHRVLSEAGSPLSVRMVYEWMAEVRDRLGLARGTGEMQVHDPCNSRFSPPVQESVRTLLRAAGWKVREMESHGRATLCCGEGGTARFLDRAVSDAWSDRLAAETGGRSTVTYCSACLAKMAPHSRTVHLADLLLDGDRALADRTERLPRSPWTWSNRLAVKRRLSRDRGEP